MDEGAMRRALTRIAYQIIERNHGAKDVLLAGVRTRGLPLADRIADKIGEVEGFRPPVIALGSSSLRDDVPRDSRAPISFPDLPALERIAEALDTDPAELIYPGRKSARKTGGGALYVLAAVLLYFMLLFVGGGVFLNVCNPLFIFENDIDAFIIWGMILLAGFIAASSRRE